MPKYYCDYCDIFLTHDSSSVRKAHNTGWKHINQVAQYYRDLEPSQTQEIIDHITFAYGGFMPPPAPRSFSPPPKYEDRGRPRDDNRSRNSGGRSQSRSYTSSRSHPYESMPPPPPPMPPTHAMSMMMSRPPMPPPGMRHPPPVPPQFRDDRDRQWSRDRQ
ncbi:U1 small nuclear ribonucleoprotein C [Coemansia linderi]|uniref:U1 small nuclear ribonucleoprotein C n=1 Tax=Coemansia linderi TaxID=2663919 RepID=A0ACC1KI60_9FUNG|nr:U1 small nuclear ribonucleoprotein C [Coemansia linderi]